MNAHAAAKPAVPVPYPSHSPHMDLDSAMSLLRILYDRLMEGALCAEDAGDFVTLMSHAFMLLEPVLGYLDCIEYWEGQQEIYLNARREWVLSRQGGAS